MQIQFSLKKKLDVNNSRYPPQPIHPVTSSFCLMLHPPPPPHHPTPIPPQIGHMDMCITPKISGRNAKFVHKISKVEYYRMNGRSSVIANSGCYKIAFSSYQTGLSIDGKLITWKIDHFNDFFVKQNMTNIFWLSFDFR